EWNDVDDGNTLYYLIEYPNTTGMIGPCLDFQELNIFPNPVQDKLYVKNETNGEPFNELTIIEATGKIVKSIDVTMIVEPVIDVSDLNQGVYFLNVAFADGTTVQKKFVK
ncbi:MAG: T9SS type A sorting domain-containing protein, partial [Crocinitomicaceae bacterium]|nr:T9SS type A sorting domain-containing protein [Crocinitomicaceae bacterium]